MLVDVRGRLTQVLFDGDYQREDSGKRPTTDLDKERLKYHSNERSYDKVFMVTRWEM